MKPLYIKENNYVVVTRLELYSKHIPGKDTSGSQNCTYINEIARPPEV